MANVDCLVCLANGAVPDELTRGWAGSRLPDDKDAEGVTHAFVRVPRASPLGWWKCDFISIRADVWVLHGI